MDREHPRRGSGGPYAGNNPLTAETSSPLASVVARRPDVSERGIHRRVMMTTAYDTGVRPIAQRVGCDANARCSWTVTGVIERGRQLDAAELATVVSIRRAFSAVESRLAVVIIVLEKNENVVDNETDDTQSSSKAEETLSWIENHGVSSPVMPVARGENDQVATGFVRQVWKLRTDFV